MPPRLPRTLEPEVMDTPAEAADYDSMDHAAVNVAFVDDFLAAVDGGMAHPPRTILDAGTGTALIPIEYCRRPGSTGRIVAIDLATEMLRLAGHNVARAGLEDCIELRHCDSKRLPFEDASFDAVMSNSIVHHIPEPLTCLSELLRVLKPGGLLFVRDLLRPDTAGEVDRLVETWAGNENENQQRLFRESLHAALRVDEVQDLLRQIGLPADRVRQTTDRHWTLAGCRPAGENTR